MNYDYVIKNLVFQGGGVLGIAYLGVLDFLYGSKMFHNVERVAGTSAGAITACITSFNLPFFEIKKIADSLDYKKIPQKGNHKDLNNIPRGLITEIEDIFSDIDCIYRLINDYGWYSTEYFYQWIKEQINAQFDSSKKLPPYTFEDFKNNKIHNNQRPFLDLYVIGTDISTNSSKVFSYETTPKMEVAEAVLISMSIPLYFESVKTMEDYTTNKPSKHIFSDGGVMRNYPINIFDKETFNDVMIDGANIQTLGARFKSRVKYSEINNIIEYIENLVNSYMRLQQDIYRRNPEDILRSIEIETDNISFTDFNISPNDAKYNFLYRQGYIACEKYFDYKKHIFY